MQLKTYRAATMAEALAQVKRDLGPDAVILHTRTVRSGGVMGVGGKPTVEITASSPEAAPAKPRPAGSSGAPRVVRTESGTYAPPHANRLAAFQTPGESNGQTNGHSGGQTNGISGGIPNGHPTDPAHHRSVHEQALRAELDTLKSMIHEVLDLARTPATSASASTPRLSGEFARLHANLLAADTPEGLASRLCLAAERDVAPEDRSDRSHCRRALLQHLAAAMPTRQDPPAKASDGPRVIALVGPTGVGKTTCIAKLAAAYKLRDGLEVGLLTADTYRIAAVDQLRTYADIIDLPMHVATTPAEARAGIDRLASCDVVLADTAGRGQHDRPRLEQLADILSALRPDETHLTLAATASQGVLDSACDRFAVLSPDRLLFTKLDEAVTFGAAPALCSRTALPISYLSTGQEVPDDLHPARSDRLARLVLDGSAPTEDAS